MSDPTTDPIDAMNALHVAIGRKAAELALEVLEAADLSEIPFPSAVALLKFGVDLERKALLGVEEDGAGADPFENLAKALNQTDKKPEEG
jgi:hypothetical protein